MLEEDMKVRGTLVGRRIPVGEGEGMRGKWNENDQNSLYTWKK